MSPRRLAILTGATGSVRKIGTSDGYTFQGETYARRDLVALPGFIEYILGGASV